MSKLPFNQLVNDFADMQKSARTLWEVCAWLEEHPEVPLGQFTPPPGSTIDIDPSYYPTHIISDATRTGALSVRMSLDIDTPCSPHSLLAKEVEKSLRAESCKVKHSYTLEFDMMDWPMATVIIIEHMLLHKDGTVGLSRELIERVNAALEKHFTGFTFANIRAMHQAGLIIVTEDDASQDTLLDTLFAARKVDSVVALPPELV